MTLEEKAWTVISDGITKEINVFKGTILSKPSYDVYREWYKIGFYEDYYEMLMSDYPNERLTENEALELAQQAYHDGNVNWSNSEETYKVNFEFENL